VVVPRHSIHANAGRWCRTGADERDDLVADLGVGQRAIADEHCEQVDGVTVGPAASMLDLGVESRRAPVGRRGLAIGR
jgi:hypothetical protein